jgi:hypothetical protein
MANTLVSNVTEKTPFPGTPEDIPFAPTSDIYIMYYRHGMNPKLEKVFKFTGTLNEARNRALKHCEVMGYRLIFVRPFMVNLEDEETPQLRKV